MTRHQNTACGRRIALAPLARVSILCLSSAVCVPSGASGGNAVSPSSETLLSAPGGRYAQAEPELRRWFRDQISPATGIVCCSEADGEFAEEDIRYDESGIGHYWTRWSAHPEWMQVPDSVVIGTPNKWGRPVVWWGQDSVSGNFFIRCYAVGSGA
jgi:hypothetical protein